MIIAIFSCKKTLTFQNLYYNICMDNTGFFTRVYELVKLIPKGRVMSYGTVAALLGNPRMSRRVGQALHVNPHFGEIPCHRVVFKNGELAHSFAFGGESVQRQMLEKEGVLFDSDGKVLEEFFIYTL